MLFLFAQRRCFWDSLRFAGLKLHVLMLVGIYNKPDNQNIGNLRLVRSKSGKIIVFFMKNKSCFNFVMPLNLSVVVILVKEKIRSLNRFGATTGQLFDLKC